MAATRRPYWALPIASGLVGAATLLALLLHWLLATHRAAYPWMGPRRQATPYISDIGAAVLKPLFVAGALATTLGFNASLLLERHLRYQRPWGPRAASRAHMLLSAAVLACSLAGTVGFCGLAVYDIAVYPDVHWRFLLLFMAGYLLFAVGLCWEYHRLIKHYGEDRKTSLATKLAFLVVEVLLSIPFIAARYQLNHDLAAVYEWIVAFLFLLFICSFAVDIRAATVINARRHARRSHHHKSSTCDRNPSAVALLCDVEGSPLTSPLAVEDKDYLFAETDVTAPHYRATDRTMVIIELTMRYLSRG